LLVLALTVSLTSTLPLLPLVLALVPLALESPVSES
jgi:hypothetical protein